LWSVMRPGLAWAQFYTKEMGRSHSSTDPWCLGMPA
jgi:hypothetical protein